MTPEQRAKKLLEPYRKQTHPEEDPGFDAMEKDIAQEIERLTAENERLLAARDECERQFQEKVAEVGRLTDAILFARSEGFEWPADPFGYQQKTMDGL